MLFYTFAASYKIYHNIKIDLHNNITLIIINQKRKDSL